MKVCGFGTYDAGRHPRVRVLLEGFAQAGAHVSECNVPIGVVTAARVKLVRQPWRAPAFFVRIVIAWIRLWRRSRRLPKPDVVVVGYLGHIDVHLARRLWPHAAIVLDYLISLEDTAIDRTAGSGRVRRGLARLDRAALRAADVICVDTEEHLELVPPEVDRTAVVAPVGAPSSWFRTVGERPGEPLRVVFFGLYTPLQGTPVIGEAIGRLAHDERLTFTMIGSGQHLDAAQVAARSNPRVEWVEWVDATKLPDTVASHDVCLGIFGAGPKALRVTPNKVYQGAAAGCVVVTSDTPPQRRALGDAAVYVPPGAGQRLAEVLAELADDPDRVLELRQAASRVAREKFSPVEVVKPLYETLSEVQESR